MMKHFIQEYLNSDRNKSTFYNQIHFFTDPNYLIFILLIIQFIKNYSIESTYQYFNIPILKVWRYVRKLLRLN